MLKQLLSSSVIPQATTGICRLSSRIISRKQTTAVSNNSNNHNNVTPLDFREKQDLYFEFSQSLSEDEELKRKTVDCMDIYPNFISSSEEENLMKELEPYISRLVYETSHWDNAITNYRETERSRWTKNNEMIINRIRAVAFPPGVPQLKMVHVLDLAKKGVINPHIDSVRYCGNTIAGLSLLSTSIMRLRHEDHTAIYCDVLLPRLSLYVQKDIVRYKFTHEILAEEESKTFKGENIVRDRRISIMCRNEPEREQSDNDNINNVLKTLNEKLAAK